MPGQADEDAYRPVDRMVADHPEWLGLLDVSGLELEVLHGSFGREPFRDDSREYVFIARR